jgi:hypothetical protein
MTSRFELNYYHVSYILPRLWLLSVQPCLYCTSDNLLIYYCMTNHTSNTMRPGGRVYHLILVQHQLCKEKDKWLSQSISFTTYISHVQFRVICLGSAVICQPFVLIVAEKNLPQRSEGRFFPSQRQRKARHDRHDQTSNFRIRAADDESN